MTCGDGLTPPKYVTAQLYFQGSLTVDKLDATGMLFRRNRYYDPSAARFTQEDPIGLAGGLNLYGFAGGDPVNYSDPFGLWPDWGKLVTGLMTLVGNYFGDLHLRRARQSWCLAKRKSS